MQCFERIVTPRATDKIFIYNEDKIYLTLEKKIPRWQEVDFKQSLLGSLYCFYKEDGTYYIFCGKRILIGSQNCKPVILKEAVLLLNHHDFPLASKAKHLAHFMRMHRFCGACGSSHQVNSEEKALYCAQCKHICYPRISPCVIVLIKRSDKKILLARSPHFPEGLYSNIAGFVEPGESLEEAVHREVFEEVSIKIKNLQYFSSQPWPFPNSLMVGYMADYDSGEISVDNVEIEDAGWFDPSNLPTFSSSMSISRWLIDAYLKTLNT